MLFLRSKIIVAKEQAITHFHLRFKQNGQLKKMKIVKSKRSRWVAFDKMKRVANSSGHKMLKSPRYYYYYLLLEAKEIHHPYHVFWS